MGVTWMNLRENYYFGIQNYISELQEMLLIGKPSPAVGTLKRSLEAHLILAAPLATSSTRALRPGKLTSASVLPRGAFICFYPSWSCLPISCQPNLSSTLLVTARVGKNSGQMLEVSPAPAGGLCPVPQ